MSQPGVAFQYKITNALSGSKKLKWWDRDRIGKPIGMIRKMVLLLSAKKGLKSSTKKRLLVNTVFFRVMIKISKQYWKYPNSADHLRMKSVTFRLQYFIPDKDFLFLNQLSFSTPLSCFFLLLRLIFCTNALHEKGLLNWIQTRIGQQTH